MKFKLPPTPTLQAGLTERAAGSQAKTRPASTRSNYAERSLISPIKKAPISQGLFDDNRNYYINTI